MIQAQAHGRPNIAEIFYSGFLQQHMDNNAVDDSKKKSDTQQQVNMFK